MHMNRGEEHPIYFWRDSTGNEIDVLIDEGNGRHWFTGEIGHTFDRIPMFMPGQYFNTTVSR